MKKTALLLLLGVLLLNVVRAQSAQQEEVMMKMLGLKTALIQKDSVSLSKLLASDVSYGHSNAWLQTKAQLIRDVVSGVQDYKSIEPSNMDIRIYDNSAVVTLQSKVNMMFQGKPLDMSMNVLLVWVKRNNDWKLVARQSVKNN